MDYFLYGGILVVLLVIGALIVRRTTEPRRPTVPGLRVEEVPAGSLPITFTSRLSPGEIIAGMAELLELPNRAATGEYVGLHLEKQLSNSLLLGVGNDRAQSFQVGITAEPSSSGCIGACVVLNRTTSRTMPELVVLRELRGRIDQALFTLDGDVEIRPLVILLADEDETTEGMDN